MSVVQVLLSASDFVSGIDEEFQHWSTQSQTKNEPVNLYKKHFAFRHTFNETHGDISKAKDVELSTSNQKKLSSSKWWSTIAFGYMTI